MSIDWTRVRLTRWGKWCRTALGTGLPKSSAFVHANTGARGPDGARYMPPDIEQIEAIINRMSASLRAPLFQKYIKFGPARIKAYNLGVPLRTYYRRIDTAEAYITRELAVESKPLDSGTKICMTEHNCT